MAEVRYYRDPELPVFEIKSCCSKVHASRKHAHDEFSIGVVVQGDSLVNGTGRDFTVTTGSIIIIPPEIVHQCNPENINKWQFEMLFLKKEWVFSWLDEIPPDFSISAKTLNSRDYARATRLFDLLRKEKYELEKEAFLITELTHFFDFENYFQQKPYLLVWKNSMQIVRDYLEANFLEKISLDELASISGLSKYHLLRNFKKTYLTSPHAYQTMLRINYAKQMLKENSSEPITTIAQEAGFYDQSHFIKTFKLYYGTTPWGYRIG